MRTIQAYGYEVTGTEEAIKEIEEYLQDRNVMINWNNFNSGDLFWNENGDISYSVSIIDHNNKKVYLEIINDDCRTTDILDYMTDKRKLSIE